MGGARIALSVRVRSLDKRRREAISSPMSHSNFPQTTNHLSDFVMPAGLEYEQAESALTTAFAVDSSPDHWKAAALTTKRKAAEFAIAIDGLSDRFSQERNFPLCKVRSDLINLCTVRSGACERIWAVANAYKHSKLTDPRHPINSIGDVFVVGLGYGLHGWGVEKYSGVETLIQEKTGTKYKFLGDAPQVLRAWLLYLRHNGLAVSDTPMFCCNVQVFP